MVQRCSNAHLSCHVDYEMKVEMILEKTAPSPWRYEASRRIKWEHLPVVGIVGGSGEHRGLGPGCIFFFEGSLCKLGETIVLTSVSLYDILIFVRFP